MQKITQEEYDAFKLRVINAVMKDYKAAKCPHYEIIPSVYLKAFNYNHKIAPIPPELFENETYKRIAAKTICDMVQESESPVMCFATEGYMAKVGIDEADLDNLPRPSQLPEDQRNEVIFLHFESAELGDYSLTFIKDIIEHSSEDFTIRLIPDKMSKKLNEEGGEVRGLFSNFYLNKSV
tara:strand:- start:715 stop:1254 length:540 start_codon:yes stop_codon:yes gene_type:complete